MSSWNVSLTILGYNVTMYCMFLLALWHSCHLPRECTKSSHWPKNTKKTCRRDLNPNLNLEPIWARLQATTELRMSRKEVFVVVTHWVLGCFLLRHYCAISWHIISDHFCFPFQSSFNCTYIHFYKFDLCIMFSKEIQSHSEKKVWSYLFILGLLIYPPVRIKKKMVPNTNYTGNNPRSYVELKRDLFCIHIVKSSLFISWIDHLSTWSYFRF